MLIHAPTAWLILMLYTRACRLSQLRSVAGKAAPNRAALKALMNSDFDPDAWDTHMSQVFDDEYYDEAEREADIQLCAPSCFCCCCHERCSLINPVVRKLASAVLCKGRMLAHAVGMNTPSLLLMVWFARGGVCRA